MKRRDFLQCAAMIVAGTTIAPSSWAMNHEQHRYLAAATNYVDTQTLTFFSQKQRAAVIAMAEQVIPATETPGATDAGVARFIELMVKDWFNDAERNLFMAGLAALQGQSNGDFASLNSADQLSLLEGLEDEASDANWYKIGEVLRVWDDEAPFICQFKELTVLGFFFSEQGATQVLRQNPMGVFKGDIPLLADDVSYASELPSRTVMQEDAK